MNKKLIIAAIRDYFVKQEDILFAYVFGSFLKDGRYRDIDLAVYSRKPDLMKLGSMRTDLVALTIKEIDLIYWNDLPRKNPTFGYKVVTKRKLFSNDTPEVHDEYKVKIFLSYFDTVRLRDDMNSAFKNRLRSNNFGERDYA